jgi:hypothetical protein
MDRNFQLYTPGVRRLYHFEFHRDQALLTAEIRRTAEAIAAAAPAKIAKGTATAEEADAWAGLWAAIAEDYAAQDAWLAAGAGTSGWSLAEKLRELRRGNGWTWITKVEALRREIEARRTAYPADVAKGRLTREQAKAQLEALEAVHDCYWRHGYAFDGTRDELAAHGEVVMSNPLHEKAAA